jgi:pimeloyl-ACP methyl ester carboxylesterase
VHKIAFKNQIVTTAHLKETHMKVRLALVAVVIVVSSTLAVAQAVQSAPQTKIEIGEIKHAKFRIDIPENWNHGLVIYCHGYETDPVSYTQKALPKVLAVFVKQGYALAQSGYSAGGWAIEQAIPDTEALRQHFINEHGKPKETYITGHSMGGLLTMAIIEKLPESYDAGLALCGPLAKATWFLQQPFDVRVMFDYYFPHALPSPAKVPADFRMTEDLVKQIKNLLDSKAEAAQVMRSTTGLHDNKDLAEGLVFGTYVLKDLQERAGGNPFDNRYTIYTGTPDDNSLNDKVERYAADPGALDYVERYYSPTGKLARPILAIHTTYDPTISPTIPNTYVLLTREAGNGNLFVQHYVKHSGHCNITPEETAQGFAELRRWKQNGVAPLADGQ